MPSHCTRSGNPANKRTEADALPYLKESLDSPLRVADELTDQRSSPTFGFRGGTDGPRSTAWTLRPNRLAFPDAAEHREQEQLKSSFAQRSQCFQIRYFANAGSVVKVCAIVVMGMRIPSAPIRPPAGVSNSIVPRMLAAAGYLSTPRVNARCPFAATFTVSVAICVPASSRTTTGIFAADAEALLTATPVAVPPVLSKAST